MSGGEQRASQFQIGPAGAVLTAVLMGAAWMQWVQARVMLILADDHVLMGGSRHLAAGQWRQLWAPQNVHLLPLYRLLRLPFDLHFPAWYPGFHAVTVAAHLASATLLFLLARRCLQRPWAAVATAFLFACSSVGNQALLWKAAAPFVFSWTFVLLGAWLLMRPGARAAAGAALALTAAVGFFTGAALAIPGVVLLVFLLAPRAGRRGLVIGAAVMAAGAAAWAVFVWPHFDLAHYAKGGAAQRLAWAAEDTARAYLYQLAVGIRVVPLRDDGPRATLWLGTLAAAAVVAAVLLLRRDVNFRWIAGMLAMTALPLAAIVTFRHAPDVWSVNRYGYQSYTFWAVMLGALLDAALRRLEARLPGPGQRAALAALAAAAAGVYFAGHLLILERSRDDLERHVITSRAFWVGWDRAFRLAAAHRIEMGKAMAAPSVDLPAGINAQTVFELCYPRGLAGITERHGDDGTAVERREFREEILRARERLPATMQARVLVP